MCPMPALSTTPKYEMKDGDSLSKWFMIGAILKDARTRDIHARIAWPILENYMQKYGNSTASVRYLEESTGLTKGSVANATQDLCEWDYFSRVLGSGKRSTVYTPNWQSARVLWRPDARPEKLGVLQPQDTSVLPPPDATDASVQQPQDESLLRNPLTSGLTERGTAAPSAPHSASPVGPAAAVPAEESGEPFAELWTAYGFPKDIALARAAYERLAPGTELHAELVHKAGECRLFHETNPDRWQKHLHNWLAEERYKETPSMPKKKAPPKLTAKPGANVVTIEAAEVESGFSESDYRSVAKFTLRDSNGVALKHRIEALHTNAGAEDLDRLISAAGRVGARDTEVMIGARFILGKDTRGRFTYSPAPANDNAEHGTAKEATP
jgi:hypothetical protein